MKLSTWIRFVKDYLTGLARYAKKNFLVRWTQKGNFSPSLPQNEAVKRYFASIDAQKYFKFHTSINSELFVEQVSSKVRNRIIPGGLIIDIGAGFCDLELTLTPDLFEQTKFIATDLQPHMLLFGRKRLEIEGHASSLFYIATDAENLALSNECADFVICVNVTPYLETFTSLVNELQRLIKKGGYLLLVQPTRNPFWEEEFEGIKLSFISDDYTLQILKDHNFVIIERDTMDFYFMPFLRCLRTTYASMFLFCKMQS